MAKLTSKTRNALPKAAFAGPNRTFPVPDKAHAANAKARATQAVNAGRMSPPQAQKIDAKANKVLGENTRADRRADNGVRENSPKDRDHAVRPGGPK